METRQEIEISAGLQVQRPPKLSTNGTFYRIFSSEKNKLRPCESTELNLRVKIKLPGEVQGIIRLLPSFIVQSLTTENCKCIASQTSDELIKPELLNRNLPNTISIRKNQEIAGLILLHNGNESFVTHYKILQ